ncbi:ABC transporter substrate-binding protein [Microlunatus sp. Y2014]|uniref:ABC transporter substrate-binding protein n=1 Tax=Microlunatus sp. Y2014 TaxID=3418488 RepID=UPI003DA713CE
MRRPHGLAKIVGIVLALTMALAACSPPGSSPETEPSGATGAGGGDIRYQLYQAPTGFSPFHATNGADGEIAGLHFRPLLSTSGEDYVPVLAESWEVSEDATTYTFTLRETNWSDGTPFTSADVVYSYESYADPDTKSAFSGRLASVAGYTEFSEGNAETISGVVAPDERTVEITLSGPNAAFLNSLPALTIVPQHVYSEIERAKFQGAPEFREPTVGIGPYIFSRWVTDDQIEFVPNEESFEEHPLSHIYAQFLAGDVARAQLETGEIDIAQLSSVDAEALAEGGKVTVQQREGTGVMSLYTALDSGKLADVKVRQAILHAIDRQSIVDNVLAGNGSVPQSMLYQPSWTIPNDLTTYDYDPEKAKQLLAEAGWDAEVEVNLDIVPGQADRDAVMDIVAGQLQAVGINAKLHPLQPAELSKLVEERKFDLLITILALPPTEPGAINDRFMCEASLNISAYCNPELDELLKQAVAISDQDQRAELYQQANKILNADQPAIPLYVSNQSYGSTARVQGFNPQQGGLSAAQNWTVTN